MPDQKTAWFCLRESLHDFRIHEWMPFGWILGLQLLFLLCALNLQTTWGMAVAGTVTGWAGEEELLHYPLFYVALPGVAGKVEWFLYTVLGSALIPLALLRISGLGERAAEVEPRGVRLRRAILPTFVAGCLNVLLLLGWQWVAGKLLAAPLLGAMPGFTGQLVLWLIMVLVSFVLSVPFLYVPVRGIQRGSSFGGALGGGMMEGLKLLAPTAMIVVVASCVALPFVAAAQTSAAVIASKMRPEIVLLLVAIYATITSFANYIIYASVLRMHWARQA